MRLGGFGINDVNHGVLVFHLLHVLFGDKRVFQDVLQVESLLKSGKLSHGSEDYGGKRGT